MTLKLRIFTHHPVPHWLNLHSADDVTIDWRWRHNNQTIVTRTRDKWYLTRQISILFTAIFTVGRVRKSVIWPYVTNNGAIKVPSQYKDRLSWHESSHYKDETVMAVVAPRHKFAHVMPAVLSWHVQNFDLGIFLLIWISCNPRMHK